MITTDQEEIVSFVQDHWRNNPKPCYVFNWDDFCGDNQGNPRKILVREKAETSLAEAVEKLYKEMSTLSDLNPKTIIFGFSEKEPSIMAKLLVHCSHPSLDLIPGCPADIKEYRQSDSIEAFALLLME